MIPATALQPGNRVFQFIPDESVLDADSTGLEQDGVQPTVADAETAPLIVELDSDFDPEDWQAGQVVVRKSVHPVDSLSVEALTPSQPASPGLVASTKRWVCEVRDAALNNDSFVVVSPVGAIEEDSFPVRAERSGLEERASQAAAAREPTPSANIAAQGEDA